MRQLEIFLDKLSLDASTTTRHLLDPDFSGEFNEDELALRQVLLQFQERLLRNKAAQDSLGYGVVTDTLHRLGMPLPSKSDDACT